jgi:hypothetical protein
MNASLQAAWAAAAAAAILSAAAWPQSQDILPRDRAAHAQSVISAWPSYPALAARAIMEEYGPPDEVDAVHLAWSNDGPWLRTVVYMTAAWPYSSQEVIEQSVGTDVPQQMWPALAGFGHGVTYDALGSELTARSASEEANFLALNCAHDIATGRMSPEAADRFYVKTMAESMAGRSSRYMKGLLFSTRQRLPASDWLRTRRW